MNETTQYKMVVTGPGLDYQLQGAVPQGGSGPCEAMLAAMTEGLEANGFEVEITWTMKSTFTVSNTVVRG